MEFTGYSVLLFVVFVGIASGELLDDFGNCMYKEVCKEEDGKNETMICLRKLGKSDSEWCLVFFRNYLKDQTLDFWKLLDIACDKPDLGGDALNDYYDARKEHEGEKSHKLNEEIALIATRDCFMAMINRCQMKLNFLG